MNSAYAGLACLDEQQKILAECRSALLQCVFFMEVILMFSAYIIVTILTAAANIYAAIVDFRRPQWVWIT
jgi:hypothetical protein